MTRNSFHGRRHRSALACAAIAALCAPRAWAGGEQALEKVTVTGTSTNLVGVADSANVGTVTQKQLEARTVYRPGELLEATPGLMWYPIEGVQLKFGYDFMAFFNTISSPRPISFDYSGLDPAYERTFRFFDGFQASLAISF